MGRTDYHNRARSRDRALMPIPVFATVRWNASDVLDIRPDWNAERAERELEIIEDELMRRMIEFGLEALEDLLPEE